MRQLTIHHLTRAELAKAYTLVQAAVPGVTFHSWRAHAGALTSDCADRRQGLLGAEDPRGLLAGIASYQVQSSLLNGLVLLVTDFIALDLVRREEVAQALTRGLEHEAQRHACSAIHFSLTSTNAAPPAWLSDFLATEGHHFDGPRYCKPLPQAH
jgi:hypothetical protein